MKMPPQKLIPSTTSHRKISGASNDSACSFSIWVALYHTRLQHFWQNVNMYWAFVVYDYICGCMLYSEWAWEQKLTPHRQSCLEKLSRVQLLVLIRLLECSTHVARLFWIQLRHHSACPAKSTEHCFGFKKKKKEEKNRKKEGCHQFSVLLDMGSLVIFWDNLSFTKLRGRLGVLIICLLVSGYRHVCVTLKRDSLIGHFLVAG